jgi:hypothetical protein
MTQWRVKPSRWVEKGKEIDKCMKIRGRRERNRDIERLERVGPGVGEKGEKDSGIKLNTIYRQTYTWTKRQSNKQTDRHKRRRTDL